jgi:hypothetical protein
MDYTVNLSGDDMQTICTGLGELKLKLVASTFGKLMTQKEQQDSARAALPPVQGQ